MATFKFRGQEFTVGTWTGWVPERGEGELFDPNLQCNFTIDEAGWVHNLLATGDELDPDANHVHIKFRSTRNGPESAEMVACSIVSNGDREHSRRAMIENINRVAGLSIPWR